MLVFLGSSFMITSFLKTNMICINLKGEFIFDSSM